MRTKPLLTFSKLDEETGEMLDRMFEKKDCMVEINPGRVILPADYMTIGQDILDMEVLQDDVWMCSYPRTGSTWAQEMVWLIGHDLDYEGAKSLQQIRCPLVELSCIMVDGHAEWHDESVKGTSVDLVKYRLAHPRYIRSHLPWDLLPMDIQREDGSAKPKVIYTSRNPKDMVVSYYHYCTLVHGLKGTFEEFCDLFMRDRAPFGPVWNHILGDEKKVFVRICSIEAMIAQFVMRSFMLCLEELLIRSLLGWSFREGTKIERKYQLSRSHTLGFWNRRHDPNLLFIKFEEMKRDLPSVVRKTADFLGKILSDEQVYKLCDHLSFQNMKVNRAVNLEAILEKSFGKSYLEQTQLRFIRKGEIGDWKNYMSDDLSRRFDDWAERHLKGTELSFE